MNSFSFIASIIAFPLISTEGAYAQESISHLAEKYRSSVVAVIALDQENRTIRTGSGFFVDRQGVIATSHHVLEGSTRAIICTPGLLPVPAPVYFKNGREVLCDTAWKEGGAVFLVIHGKGYAISYQEEEIEMKKSFDL